MSHLWKIQKPGHKPSYLCGSVHFSSADLQRLIPFYTKEFQRADKVVFEHDMPRFVAATNESLTKKSKFKDLHPDAKWYIEKHLEGFKEASELENMLLDEVMWACLIAKFPDRDKYNLNFNYVHQNGFEFRLYKEAVAKGKRVGFLDTQDKTNELKTDIQSSLNPTNITDDVLLLLNRGNWAELLQGLMHQSQYELRSMADLMGIKGFIPIDWVGYSAFKKLGLKLPDTDKEIFSVGANLVNKSSKILQDIIDLYVYLDSEALGSTVASQTEKQEWEKKHKERNHQWMIKMQEMLTKDDSVFFVVGAAHLGTSDGLIELLKAKGFNVTPVENYTDQLKESDVRLNLNYMGNSSSEYLSEQLSECSLGARESETKFW